MDAPGWARWRAFPPRVRAGGRVGAVGFFTGLRPVAPGVLDLDFLTLGRSAEPPLTSGSRRCGRPPGSKENGRDLSIPAR
jgi:hypothetical protein